MSGSPERLLAVLTWAEAEQITVPPSAAARLLEALDAVPSGTPPRKPWTRWTPEEDAELRRRFVAGEPVREIAEALNRSRGQINGALTRLALTRSGEPQQSTLVHRNGAGPGSKGRRKRNDAANTTHVPECPSCGAAPGQAHEPTCGVGV